MCDVCVLAAGQEGGWGVPHTCTHINNWTWPGSGLVFYAHVSRSILVGVIVSSMCEIYGI